VSAGRFAEETAPVAASYLLVVRGMTPGVARWARRALLTVLVVLIGIQFIRPDRTNPPVTAAHSLLPHAPADVRAILDRSCRDCHSSETRWPLYSEVAPMSWMVASHVHDGRDRFNYSEWTAYDTDEQDKLLGSMCSLTKRGRMPVPSYLWIHRDAKLAPGDVAAICAWSEKMRDTLQ
jgi:Haem-binding domain